tara:strand:- start:842 stop:1849 length:1008 start_codon:yes stop_codon:yes gene_type:complete
MKKILLLILLLYVYTFSYSQGVSMQSAKGSHLDIAYLNSINVKTLRIQIKPIDRVDRTKVTPQVAFNVELSWALRIVEECNKVGIKPVIAFNEILLTDSLSDETPEFWTDSNLSIAYFNIGKVVAKFANKVYAYEFISEPVIVQNSVSTSPSRLEEFYTKTLQIVRQRDTTAYVILTPGPWGMPTNYNKFLPFNIVDSKLIYNFHMYLPFNYTHQGLNNRPKGIIYPNAEFNVDTILKRFKVVSEWSIKYNYPIFLGEFNTVRWSKNSDLYVQDVIDAAKLYNFEWCYFAFKPNYKFWNPYYEIGNPNANPTKYYLKYIGPDTQQWLMIQYNLKY